MGSRDGSLSDEVHPPPGIAFGPNGPVGLVSGKGRPVCGFEHGEEVILQRPTEA